MTPTIFMSSLLFLLTIFFSRKMITKYINSKYDLKHKIQSEWIVYTLSFLFIIIISLGMLLDPPKEGALSKGFDKLEPSANKRPNPLFDVNTYF